MKAYFTNSILEAMLLRDIKNKEISNSIMDLANKNNISITEEQSFNIASIVNSSDSKIYQEEPYELINIIISLHSKTKIKIGNIESDIFNKELKKVLINYISEKYAHCFRRTYQKYYTTLRMPIPTISQKIKDFDYKFLVELRAEIKKALEKEKFEKKNSNYIKSTSRNICEELHPDYLDYIKGLSKKEVCFIYDVLVFAKLKHDNGMTSDDDKYDNIKRYFIKQTYEDNGYEYIDYKDIIHL